MLSTRYGLDLAAAWTHYMDKLTPEELADAERLVQIRQSRQEARACNERDHGVVPTPEEQIKALKEHNKALRTVLSARDMIIECMKQKITRLQEKEKHEG